MNDLRPPAVPLDDEVNDFMRRLVAACGLTVPEWFKAALVQDCHEHLMKLVIEVPVPQGAIAEACKPLEGE